MVKSTTVDEGHGRYCREDWEGKVTKLGDIVEVVLVEVAEEAGEVLITQRQR